MCPFFECLDAVTSLFNSAASAVEQCLRAGTGRIVTDVQGLLDRLPGWPGSAVPESAMYVDRVENWHMRTPFAVGDSMRGVCDHAMIALARRTPDLIAVGTDGPSAFESISREFPDRYVDVGIAEACAVGVAAGLARTGYRPFVTAIASFLVRRAYEQIRIDVVEPGLDVTFIGHGAGLGYGTLGSTHHLVEDIALFQSMPTSAILEPADARETEWALAEAARVRGPVYVRVPARVPPDIVGPEPPIEPGRPRVLRRGADLAIIASGPVVCVALTAADRLLDSGIRCTVVGVPSIKPFDVDAIRELVAGTRGVVVAAEHARPSGLGYLILDALAGSSLPVTVLGINDCKPVVGSYPELLRFHGLDADSMVETARRVIESGAQPRTVDVRRGRR